MASRFTTLMLLSAAAAVIRAQQQSPLLNFCRRFDHQTAVIDDRLFIDGGYIVHGGQIDASSTNDTHTWLVYADLTTVNDLRFPDQYANLSKPATVPSVAGGTLWADTVNKLFYLYGGEYNDTTTPPTNAELWFFDAIWNTWNTTAANPASPMISPRAYGSSVVDQERGTGYWYGGWVTNKTSAESSAHPVMQAGLIAYDMEENQWSNTQFVDDVPRAEGAMFYIPASDSGMLVYFGGLQQSSDGSSKGVPMNEIHIYDIASQSSYKQNTTGDVPGMRRRFCGGVSWPEDQSSYNIYIFGGLQPTGEEGYGYGSVWILTLPSFTWTTFYEDDSTAGKHHSLSCNVVQNGQMMLIGGWWPDSSNTNCDVPEIWGEHNMDLGADNVDAAAWYQFQPNVTHYTVPTNVTEIIGGGATGGATVMSPSRGFSDPDLEIYFSRKAPTGTRSATRPLPATDDSKTSSEVNKGAIGGGVVGGVAALVLIAVFALWYTRRQKKRKARESVSSRAELPEDSALESPSTMRDVGPLAPKPPAYEPPKPDQRRSMHELMGDSVPMELEEQRRPQEMPVQDR